MSRNVICFVIDRLRASALGAYGAAWCDTPAIDRWASESVVFDVALAEQPCLASLYRSYWQGIHAMSPELAGADLPSLPEVLSEKGATTALLTDDATVADHPLAREFDDRVLIEEEEGTATAPDLGETQFAGFVAAAIDWVAGAQTRVEPFFLWLHARGLSAPWDAPLEYRNRLADEEDPQPPTFTEPPNRMLSDDYDPDELLGICQAYSGQVAALDECLGLFWNAFHEACPTQSTLLLLMGARGFPLGEHGRVGSVDEPLYGETVHVPLIVRTPGAAGGLSRSPALVQSSDLGPTLADWMDAQNGLSEAEGQSLMPVIRGELEHVREYVCMASGGQRAIRTPAWHLRQPPDDGQAELFLKPDDRWEANEISDRCPDVVAGLRQAIAHYEACLQSSEDIKLSPLDAALLTPPE